MTKRVLIKTPGDRTDKGRESHLIGGQKCSIVDGRIREVLRRSEF